MDGIWYPAAIQQLLADSGPYVGGPYRGVVHSTEGSSYAGAWGAYRATGDHPHLTVSYESGRFQAWQHLSLDRAASALVHPAGTQTNRQSAVQIEIVGFAAHADTFPRGLLDGLRDLMRWIEDHTGIKPRSPQFLPYPQSAGANGVRMTAAEWLAFDGWCGHEHVVGNEHGDPGAIAVDYLLRRTGPTPSVPAPGPATHDFEEGAMKSYLLKIGPLDGQGNGWADYDPALGRDPNIVGAVVLGPSPPDDGNYWPNQAHVTVAAQPRGGKARVVIRNGTPADTVSVWVTVS